MQCFLTHRKTGKSYQPGNWSSLLQECGLARPGQDELLLCQLPHWVSGRDSLVPLVPPAWTLEINSTIMSYLWLCNVPSLFSSRRPRNTSQPFSHILIAVCRLLFLCLTSAVPAFPSVHYHVIVQVLTRLICRIPGSERPTSWCKCFSRDGKCWRCIVSSARLPLLRHLIRCEEIKPHSSSSPWSPLSLSRACRCVWRCAGPMWRCVSSLQHPALGEAVGSRPSQSSCEW